MRTRSRIAPRDPARAELRNALALLVALYSAARRALQRSWRARQVRTAQRLAAHLRMLGSLIAAMRAELAN